MRRITRVNPGRWLFVAKAMLLVAFLAFCLGKTPPASAGTQIYPCDNERLGFGVVSGIEHYDVMPLRAGWYVNWHAVATAPNPGGMDFAQIIRTNNYGYWPAGAELAAIIEHNPGTLWLISNEPDSPVQDNTSPEPYARVYHNAYSEIKRLDPAARIAIGGIIGATPVRMKWLDMVWEAYQRLYGAPMPVDVWNVHAFVLREVRPGYGAECAPPGSTDTGTWGALIPPGVPDNCGQWITINDLDRHDLFQEQIIRFRTWMRDHGQQDKELVVSEYGILFPEELGYTYPRVRDYMLWTFNYFLTARDPQIGYPGDDYHLVQRWAWYSLDDNNFGWGTTRSALMTSYDANNPTVVPQFTQLGNDFAQYASAKLAACTTYVDLRPVRLKVTPAAAIPYGTSTTLRVTIEVQNQGTVPSPTAQVHLYDGTPGAGGVLLATVPLSPVPARYQGTVAANWDWTLNATGSRTLIAVVDPANQIAESREGNNNLAVPVSFGTVNLVAANSSWRLNAGPLRPGEAAQITLLPGTLTLSQIDPPSPGLNVVPVGATIAWYDGDAPNGRLIASTEVAAPAAFGSPYAPPAQPWAPVLAGPRKVRFTASLANAAAETTLADNEVQVPVPANGPDLILTQVSRMSDTPAIASSDTFTVYLRAQVANLGTLAPAGVPIVVGLRAGTGANDPEVGRAQLAATGDWTLPLVWAGLPKGAHPYLALVDPDNLVPESREDNNTWLGSLITDVKKVYLPLMRRR